MLKDVHVVSTKPKVTVEAIIKSVYQEGAVINMVDWTCTLLVVTLVLKLHITTKWNLRGRVLPNGCKYTEVKLVSEPTLLSTENFAKSIECDTFFIEDIAKTYLRELQDSDNAPVFNNRYKMLFVLEYQRWVLSPFLKSFQQV